MVVVVGLVAAVAVVSLLHGGVAGAAAAVSPAQDVNHDDGHCQDGASQGSGHHHHHWHGH